MDDEALTLTLAVMAFAIALNLKLTLSVLRSARRAMAPPTPLQPGEAMPDVVASMLAGRGQVRLGAPGPARALLFLSSQCPKCRATAPRIAALVDTGREAGLEMWIVSDEARWRLYALLRGTALAARTLRLHRRDYRLINPLGASPAYLFADHEGTIEATGLIGDADWIALERQLTQEVSEDCAA